MNNTKVFGIESDNFYEFIKKINEFYLKSKVFATQTSFQNNKWFAVIYYESQSGLESNIGRSLQPPLESNSMGKKEKVNAIPISSPADIPPTKGQIKFLQLNNLEIPKTKKLAWQMINSFKNKKEEY